MVIRVSGRSDENYHVSVLDPETRKVIGKEERFQTLEEVLGFLHKFEEMGEMQRQMLVCLMGLRDGESEVLIHRKMLRAGNQILKIRPPKRFSKLFWEGSGEKVKG
jgi:hypothetical protein